MGYEDDLNIVKTKEETDKKCPQCGGVMDFDPASGNLKCPYCDYEEKIPIKEEEPKKAAELDLRSAEFTANKDWGVETKTVICKACGAESIYDALQTSAVCPFCGSNQVMDQNDKDTIAPGGVVPFQISDEKASELFRTWIGKKFYCPKLAKTSARADKFKGIYLPYWTFDAQTYSEYQGEYGIDHTYEDSEGNEKTRTDWYRTQGNYKKFFDDELVLASTKHTSSMMKGLEPFDTENNVAYKPEYIAGFVAERYSVGLEDGWKSAKASMERKIKSDVESKIRKDHHADRSQVKSIRTEFDELTYKYLLLPIWMSSFKYKDKVYQFVVNGQNGKISGDTPVSVPKVILTIAAVIAIIVICFYLFR
ncbi:MAG: hypothetical protein IJ733_17990 [Lachnospiraceae bacterium]|nr:hypothetical protein [Lachnospiraceae bacterium]